LVNLPSDFARRWKRCARACAPSPIEGKNMGIEFGWADGHPDLLHELEAERVRLKVDVRVVHSNAVARVAKQATATIPIGMAIGTDAVATGFVESLRRPGGNLTGSTILTPEIEANRLALLKEAVPHIARTAVICVGAVLIPGRSCVRRRPRVRHLIPFGA
jgi:ABC-type uncharacterized transport system substrate-binding protein